MVNGLNDRILKTRATEGESHYQVVAPHIYPLKHIGDYVFHMP
jgi:hypothetical protein